MVISIGVPDHGVADYVHTSQSQMTIFIILVRVFSFHFFIWQ